MLSPDVEPRPRTRPGQLRANFKRTCPGWVVVKIFGRGERERKTRALNQEAAAGWISMIGSCDGGRIFFALLAPQEAGVEPTNVPDCRVNPVRTAATFWGTH